jgi:hypothetical protein
MANTIRIKRRASGGSSGAPTSLENAELAFTEVDDVLYYGKGTGGAGGSATSVIAIGGSGAFATLGTNQTISGDKTFSVGTTTTFSGSVALGSSATATTQSANDNSTKVATTAYVESAVSAATVSAEQVQDIVGAQIATNGSHTGISATYQDSDGDGAIDFSLTDTTVTAGSYGSSTSVAGFTVDAKGRLTAASNTSIRVASTSQTGLASFDSTDFSVTTGNVTLNAERIQDIIGGMVSSNTESGISVTYDDDNGKLDFNVADPTITIAGDVDGNATMTNLGNTTITVTLDTVNSNAGSFGSSTAIPVVTVNEKGLVTAVTTASLSTALSVGADTGTADSVTIGTDTLQFTGGEGIDTAVTNNTITISGEDATTSNKGVASFSSDNFSVSSGAVTIKDGGIANAELVNSTITLGSSTLTLGSTTTSVAGITELTVDNLNFNGNSITSTDSNGNITLSPNGTGTVDVASSRITGLSEPVSDNDAATKYYVDNKITGLDWKAAVNLIAKTNVSLTGSTETLIIDGHAALDSADDGIYRILLTAQSTGSQNGIYTYTDDGTDYELVRATDADVYTELIGASVYVMEGTSYTRTGWVQTNHYLTDFTSQSWVQFSGAGAYAAGAGLSVSGTEFAVNVATNGGIEIDTDALQLKTSVAGAGLTYSTGVIAVGGTADKITVDADAITIASTYAGQSSITTLGTIATGTWNGNAIPVAYGGTGSTSASDARTALGLAIGTNVQAYSPNLGAIAGVTSAADALPYFTGSGTAAVTTLSSFIRGLLDDANAATARTTLGVDTYTIDGGTF